MKTLISKSFFNQVDEVSPIFANTLSYMYGPSLTCDEALHFWKMLIAFAKVNRVG